MSIYVFLSFKYYPKVLKNILFSSQEPSRKRRRISVSDDQEMVDDTSVDEPEIDARNERTREIVLETSKERFLISPAASVERDSESGANVESSARTYIVSSIVETIQICSKPVNGEGKSSSTKLADSVPKPSPPTWSTPPAIESERASTAASTKRTCAWKSPPANSPPTKYSTQVLSVDRGQEHFHFMPDGISIDGLGARISVKSWRWALAGEFRS